MPYTTIPTPNTTITVPTALVEALQSDFDAGVLDYDDPKWDEWDGDTFQDACLALGLA